MGRRFLPAMVGGAVLLLGVLAGGAGADGSRKILQGPSDQLARLINEAAVDGYEIPPGCLVEYRVRLRRRGTPLVEFVVPMEQKNPIVKREYRLFSGDARAVETEFRTSCERGYRWAAISPAMKVPNETGEVVPRWLLILEARSDDTRRQRLYIGDEDGLNKVKQEWGREGFGSIYISVPFSVGPESAKRSHWLVVFQKSS